MVRKYRNEKRHRTRWRFFFRESRTIAAFDEIQYKPAACPFGGTLRGSVHNKV